jgi:sugar phosphate isomerase/epimerase
MNRRDLLKGAAASTVASAAVGLARGAAPRAPAERGRSALGIVEYSLASDPRAKSALQFLERCHALGAGGVQVALDSLAPEYTDQLRRRAEELAMYVEVIAELPQAATTAEFERLVVAARRAGAGAMRAACLSGRRYETFGTLEEWKRFVAESRARLRLAAPIAERYKLPLGIENHKDWTGGEFSALLREFSSEYLGVCLDFGNNLALLDDPRELVDALAPYAVTTHVKDMAVEEYADGFLLAEVPLGQGALDLAAIVAAIRQARPQARFNLEMITRDPLEIPCLTEKYWATFPERNGNYLARTLAWVRAHRPRQPLPRVSGLDPTARARLEETNVLQSLGYARERLGLAA